MLDNYYASQPSETELTKLEVKGTLPKWLQGKLVRNGPALFEVGKTSLQHWFDGFGMLHGFTISNGEVYYQSKFIESPEYMNDQAKGKVETVTWGTASDPCRSIFRRFFANFSAVPSNTPVNVVKIGQRYFATSDIATLNEFDLKELDTLSTLTTTKQGVMAAHPAFTSDGRVWNMISHIGPVVKNEIIAFDESAKHTTHKVMTRSKLYYFHSFGNTDRYFVTIEMPLYLSFPQLVGSGATNKSFYECFHWDDQATNIFHIFDRQTGELTKIESNLKFFYFHTINTYEEDGKLTIDLCGYNSSEIIDDFYLSTMATSGIADENKSSLRRVVLDFATSSATMEDLGINFELPGINHEYGGKGYRYAYGVQSDKDSPRLADAVIKYDFHTREQIRWQDKHLLPGEPVFVPAPTAKSEDDGILLVVCHDTHKHVACLVVLDAQNLRVIATAYTPKHIPISLHGSFYRQ
ncbi:MAG TPA: carotenoid oxygenase family protein [Candidatus Saccharimonadales bacterium]|nr:carotenoid oxygenase family protein [Candidatus Saccharimonadales bacterium]